MILRGHIEDLIARPGLGFLPDDCIPDPYDPFRGYCPRPIWGAYCVPLPLGTGPGFLLDGGTVWYDCIGPTPSPEPPPPGGGNGTTPPPGGGNGTTPPPGGGGGTTPPPGGGGGTTPTPTPTPTPTQGMTFSECWRHLLSSRGTVRPGCESAIALPIFLLVGLILILRR